jgi:RNA polymerase sigma factor (sigma-70 family)
MQSRDALIQEGRRWPETIARMCVRYIPAGLVLDDLIAVGNLALCRAAEEYDPSRGARFFTMAYPRIRGAMFDALRDWSFYSRAYHVQQKQRGHEVPAVASLSGEWAKCLPSEEPALESIANRTLVCERIRQIIDALPERERNVVRWYFFEGVTHREISKRLGVSKTRAYQMHHEVLRKLRRNARVLALVLE